MQKAHSLPLPALLAYRGDGQNRDPSNFESTVLKPVDRLNPKSC